MKRLKEENNYSKLHFAGLVLTPLRICTGWLLFSAMWRRVVLKPEALDVHSPMYEGLKFNHFLVSGSSIIKPMVLYLIAHPEFLFIFLWVFSILEGLVGLALIFGLFTRLAALGAFFILLGIMLGAGWLGTTCVDEWTIGVLGITSAIVLFFKGGGPISLDELFYEKSNRFWKFISSGPIFTTRVETKTYRTILTISIFAFAFTLITNQFNVGGVWGPFKNPAIKPMIALSNANINSEGVLSFTLFRTQGPDTYGAYVTHLLITNSSGKEIFSLNEHELGQMPLSGIHNRYLVQVKPNGQSLFVPLAGKADIEISSPELKGLPKDTYTLELVDISNEIWKTSFRLRSSQTIN